MRIGTVRVGRSVSPERNRVAEVGSGPVFVRVHVPVRDLADVRVGQKAQIEARTLGREVSGQVASVGTMDGQPTRSAPASILIPDPGGRWWPGLDVTVKLEKESFVAAVGISRSALQTLDGQSVVFVRSGDWFEVRRVKVGRPDDDVVEITQGLTSGERYAATNSDQVRAMLLKGAPSPRP